MKQHRTILNIKSLVALVLVFMLTGCGVRRLEDVMGPSSLAQPPGGTGPVPIPAPIQSATPSLAATPPPTPLQSPAPAQVSSLAVPPADINAPESPDSPDDADEPGVPPTPPAEQLSPLLVVQENRTLFKTPNHWEAFQTDNGIDATNAAGTVCSGRLGGSSGNLIRRQKISLACSDGTNATLEIRELRANDASGVMIIGNNSQTVNITKSSY